MTELEKNIHTKAFKDLTEEVSQRIGVDYNNYSPRHLRRRFHARMRTIGTPTFSGYLEYMRENGNVEIEKLRDLLTVNVTKFKRDGAVWDKIEGEVIPELIEKNKDRKFPRLQFWSAGCATGEEPYSLAISYLKERFSRQVSCKILATDFDHKALDFARKGEYPDKSVKNLDYNEKRSYLEKIDDGWRVKSYVKELVEFREKDIFRTDFNQKFDLILCRNLMIYFNEEAKARLMVRLVESLKKDGFLVLGMAENLRSPARERIDTHDLNRRIFKKVKKEDRRFLEVTD